MANGFTVKTGTTATALSAATARTLCNVITGTRPIILVEFGVSFDGVTATAVPVLVELCGSTQGAAGTLTAFTPLPIRPMGGDASIATAGIDYTVEPTTVTPFKHWLVTPNGGLVVIQFPLGREMFGTSGAASAGKGILIRCTAPAAVNARGYMEFEE